MKQRPKGDYHEFAFSWRGHGNGGSPRLYREGDDYLVQGYLVTEPELLAKLRIPPGETANSGGLPRPGTRSPVQPRAEQLAETSLINFLLLSNVDPGETGLEPGA
jgi:hypothetical protein